MSFDLARFFNKYDPVAQLFPSMGKAPVKVSDWMNEKLASVAKHDPAIKLDRKIGIGSWTPQTRAISDYGLENPWDMGHLAAGAYFGAAAAAPYLGGGGGAAGGTGADATLGVFANGGKAGLAGVGGGNAGALAASGGITGGAGVGGTGAYGAQLGQQFNQYSKLANQVGGMMGSNPVAPVPPPQTMGGSTGGYSSSTPTNVTAEGEIEKNDRPKDRRGFGSNRMGPFMYRGQIIWL